LPNKRPANPGIALVKPARCDLKPEMVLQELADLYPGKGLQLAILNISMTN
jgi:hypothetical protein